MPGGNLEVWFDELSKVYGPCFTVWSPLPCVVITDYDHVKEAFVTQGETYTYRAHRPPESLLQPYDNTGILNSSGENWRLQRRTSLKILRDFGMGRNLMEEQIVKSIQELMVQLTDIKDKKVVDIFWPIQLCIGNVINEFLFGFHYKYNDCERFKTFVGVVDYHLRILLGKCSLLVSAFLWLRHLPIIGEHGYHRIKRNIKSYQWFIEEEVASQVTKYNKDSEPENFVHAYLQQMEQTGHPGLDIKNLNACVLDFWLAGMETTSNAIRWHIAYMMKYPEIQEKVREEIFNVVGTSRLPSMSDKPSMPYTQAVIHEVQRHSNMVPFLGTHQSMKDTEIFGNPIPAGTNVLAQPWSVMRNDPVFENPLQFNPNRYLLPDGQSFDKAVLDRTIPFSLGKRSCVGEGLARMELF
uniref:Cytochrome P450 n=1 Tax=Caenorhabditis tropicalis TaxID=1561998 RepID=A0A1I7TNA3_9PELO